MNKVRLHMLIAIAVGLFIVLYSVVSYFFIAQNHTGKNDKLNLLATKPILAFGKSLEEKDDSIQIKLNKQGQAAIVFTQKDFNAQDFSQISYQISKLPNNYICELIWISNNNPEPQRQLLLQANGEKQHFFLSKTPNWNNSIKQIGLQFSPQIHLGIKQASKDAVLIKSMTLENSQIAQNYFTLLNYWLDFSPWTYRSINHLALKKDLPVYAQLPVFLLTWIILVVLVLQLSKINLHNKTVLFSILFSAWLIIDFQYLYNLQKQLNWVQSLPIKASEKISDKRLLQIAQELHKIMGFDAGIDVNVLKKHKVFILTNEHYQRLRLIYHCLPANCGFLGTEHINPGDYILSYDARGEFYKPIDGILTKGNLTIKVKELKRASDFSIMQVLK